MAAIWQTIEVVFKAIFGYLEAFISVLPIVNQLNDIKTEMIACVFGIPLGVFTVFEISKYVLKVIKFIWSHYQND